MCEQEQKLSKLKRILDSMESMIIAFSGGVDSTVLLKVASEMKPGKSLAVMAVSSIISAHDKERAKALAEMMDVTLELMPMEPLSDDCFMENTPRRCYHCKHKLFEALIKMSGERGFERVLDGTNRDDLSENRPGMKALEELGIRSPLAEAGLTKQEIRELARRLIPDVADSPENTCLATRIPFYDRITREKLEMVEMAEACLAELGIEVMRVRNHNKLARIEVLPSAFGRVIHNRTWIAERFRHIGFDFVTLDIQGFRGAISASDQDDPR